MNQYNQNKGITLSQLYANMCCFIFGHRYRLKRDITPHIREVKCLRCDKMWGMNDETNDLLPLDDDLLEIHEMLKVNKQI
jgi:hypothetical protein